jgi:hypothetical protein
MPELEVATEIFPDGCRATAIIMTATAASLQGHSKVYDYRLYGSFKSLRENIATQLAVTTAEPASIQPSMTLA